jgi:cytochrome b561
MPPERYSTLQVTLHWISAALILFSLVTGELLLSGLPNDAGKLVPLGIHLVTGALIGVVMLARLLVRYTGPQPARTTTGNATLDRLSRAVHAATYVGAIGMVASGAALALQADLPAIVFGGSATPLPADFWEFTARRAHAYFAWALIALVALHVCGALYHQFVRKDRLMSRMGLGRRQSR